MEDPRLKDFVENWKLAGPILKAMREENIRNADTAKAIEALSGCFQSAIRTHPPRKASGLAELQRWFKIFRERNPELAANRHG
ncbi:MAG: hypothetical protein GC164_10825 [Phycisphaera sp.]|nr:hypothetical protein [Phycisphaera sp.]